MEDASAVDLDWFFEGWFSTDFVDYRCEEVKQYYVSETATKGIKDATLEEDVLDRKRTFHLFRFRN
jgi:hypothetical protein